MDTTNFSDDFKRDAVFQITKHGYRVAGVSERLGGSKHSLYAWKKQFTKPASSVGDERAAAIHFAIHVCHPCPRGGREDAPGF